MDWDSPKYSLREAAEISGWPINTMRDYFGRGVFAWQEGDATAEVAGSTSLLSRRSVMRLAIARELWGCCQRPKEAFLAAIRFTDFGSRSHDAVSRLPGELFAAPYSTVLVFRPGSGGHVLAFEDGVKPSVEELTDDVFGTPGAAVVLRVNGIFQSVLRLLNVEPAEG